MSIKETNYQSLEYPSKTVERAERSLVCSPFKLQLFQAMREGSVAMQAIALNEGVKHGYTQRPLSELTADNALNWLIQVGVLRREVDGQGITDGFRLTPLGKQLVEQCGGSDWRTPEKRDRIYNALIRWLRLPF